jgi:hypothetical protein
LDSHEQYIFEHCQILIKEFKKRQNKRNNNYDVDTQIQDLDAAESLYKEVKSIKKFADLTGLDENFVRYNFRNLIRVPQELRSDVLDGKLCFDPILAKEIALYVTDFLNWDGDIEKEKKVLEMAKAMSACLSKPENLEMRKVFFSVNEDYTKPVNATTEARKRIKEICELYPFQQDTHRDDRTYKQYMRIVYFMNNPDAAEFLRRWEYEKGRRITKKWASELIGDPERFLELHKNEFKD